MVLLQVFVICAIVRPFLKLCNVLPSDIPPQSVTQTTRCYACTPQQASSTFIHETDSAWQPWLSLAA